MLRLVPGPRGRLECRLVMQRMHVEADLAAVTKLIEPEVKALGFDLVRVAMIQIRAACSRTNTASQNISIPRPGAKSQRLASQAAWRKMRKG